jgi:adenylate cyclase
VKPESLDSPRRPLILGGIALSVLLLLSLSQIQNKYLATPKALTQKTAWWIQDQIHLHGTRAPADPDILVIGVDEASLDLSSAFPEDIAESPTLQLMQKGWPWPRQVWADLLDKLFASGARAVALDFAYATPSPDHPEWDAAFNAALEKYKDRVVIGADLLFSENKLRLIPPTEKILTTTNLQTEPRIGYFTYWPDEDDVVRRSSVRSGENTNEARSFPAALLDQARLPNQVPGDPHQPHLIRFGPDDAYTPISAHELFIPAIWDSNYAGGSIFKDKIILIGPTARHFQDDVPTPIGTLFGVQVHAHTTAAFRHGHLLTEVTDSRLILGIALIGILGILLFIARFRRPIIGISALFGIVALTIYLQTYAFNQSTLVVAMLLPATGSALAGFLSLGYDYIHERRQRERLRAAITGYFSPDMEQQILRQPASYFKTLRGTHRHITLLFSDLRGFTSLSEKLPPEQLVLQLNEYLDRMVQTVFETNGSIDKFIGDAIMAVWGRLRDNATEADLITDARAAATTALRMREELTKLNELWATRGIDPLAVGIGLHQGEAVVGDMGSQLKKEFTAIGDSVNTAARLESATKQYGLDLLISDSLRHHLGPDFLCRTADLVKVKGKTEPVAVFTLLGKTETTPPPPGLAEFETGIQLYRTGDFPSAITAFQKAATAGLNDTLTITYLERCQDLIDHPPESWDGTYTLKSK